MTGVPSNGVGPDKTGKQQGCWQPGRSGNPAGRPKGSRNKLSEDFLRAFAQDFEQHGAAVIKKVRQNGRKTI